MSALANRIALAGAVVVLFACAALAQDEVREYTDYKGVVEKTAAMVSDPEARRLCGRHGLNILNVTWEDTGRFKNSAVGPNISDMTLQVQLMDPRDERFRLYCMPVIRYPNFTDKTGDIKPEKFYLLVGNEEGRRLRRVNLKQFLKDIRKYLHCPDSWKGDGKSLLAERDTRVLVSAQACFLPIPKGGKATFNPVLFNYQSYKGDPAVLTILATREGTSVTVIDNVRDRFLAGRTWGQRLFFNQDGKRASFTGQRISDFAREDGKRKRPTAVAAGQRGLNMVLLIQVPLKQKRPRRLEPCAPEEAEGLGAPAKEKMRGGRKSDVEEAVIGHGRVEGPFTEIDDLEIERDPKYPIRVTVQFYKATSNGVVCDADIAEVSRQIERVYREADYVGSLVVEGETSRPTEHDGPKVEPPGWWNDFWRRYEENTGQSMRDAIIMLRELYGPNWYPKTEEELAEAIRRAEKHRDK